jgi:hypothetical protein
MKVKVKIFGILAQRFPDYNPDQGLEIEISEGARVDELLAQPKISDNQGGGIILDGRPLKGTEKLPRGASVSIVQTMYGG